MSGWLLDSNVLIWLLRGSKPLLSKRVRQHQPENIFISTIGLHELYSGAFRSQNMERALTGVDGFAFTRLAFDNADAIQAGQLRALLTTSGQVIGPYDLLIAAQALTRDLTLVTHNSREFSRVPGLKLEDWEG